MSGGGVALRAQRGTSGAFMGHQERSDCCHPSGGPAAHVRSSSGAPPIRPRSIRPGPSRCPRDSPCDTGSANPVGADPADAGGGGGSGPAPTGIAASFPPMPRALTQPEVDHYREHGWLRIERRLRGRGARRARPRPRLADRNLGDASDQGGPGHRARSTWTRPPRRRSQLIALHNLRLYFGKPGPARCSSRPL